MTHPSEKNTAEKCDVTQPGGPAGGTVGERYGGVQLF